MGRRGVVRADMLWLLLMDDDDKIKPNSEIATGQQGARLTSNTEHPKMIRHRSTSRPRDQVRSQQYPVYNSYSISNAQAMPLVSSSPHAHQTADSAQRPVHPPLHVLSALLERKSNQNTALRV